MIKGLLEIRRKLINKIKSNFISRIIYILAVFILLVLGVFSLLSYFGLLTFNKSISNIKHESGYGYQYIMFQDQPLHRDINGIKMYLKMQILNFLIKADSIKNPGNSKIVVLENDIPLSSPHSFHKEIRETGKGRYSHWINTLYFSTSDNSDPNTNNKEYKIQYQLSVPFFVFFLVICLLILMIFPL